MKKRILAKGMALLAVVFALGVAGQAQTVTVPRVLVGYPDLIVHNAKIVTMDDPSFQPTAGHIVQAMAVRQAKILAVGTDAEILALAGPDTRKIDLKGRTVIPA